MDDLDQSQPEAPSLEDRVEALELDPELLARMRSAALLTALVGAIHAVLLVSAVLIINANAPSLDASDQELLSTYADAGNRRLLVFAGIYLIPFAGISWIWFTVALRGWLQRTLRRLDTLLANVLLVASTIYIGLLFVAGAAMSVTAVVYEFDPDALDPVVSRLFPQYGAALTLVFAMRVAAMIVFVMSNIGRKTGALPKWFAYSGFALGVLLLLTASLDPLLILVFPAWILIFSAILFQRVRAIRIPPAAKGD